MENEFEVTVRQTLVKTTSVFTDAVHECVERDGEVIPARLQREITKLEARAKQSVEAQKKAQKPNGK